MMMMLPELYSVKDYANNLKLYSVKAYAKKQWWMQLVLHFVPKSMTEVPEPCGELEELADQFSEWSLMPDCSME